VASSNNQVTTCQALSIGQIRASTSLPQDTRATLARNLKAGKGGSEITGFQECHHQRIPSQTKKASLPETIKQFWSIKDKLSIDDDLIVFGSCLIKASPGHKQEIGILFCWPGIDKDSERHSYHAIA